MESRTNYIPGTGRSDAMRGRLVNATLELITRVGWAATSIPKICRQAETSRGAQTHHFPTKNALLLTAVEQLTRQFDDTIRGCMTDCEIDRGSRRVMLDVVWAGMQEDSYAVRSMEALVAARTDAELRAGIAALDDDTATVLRALVDPSIFAPEAIKQVWDVIELSIYLFRGMVLQQGLHNDEKPRRRLFHVWCELVEDAFNAEAYDET